MIKRQQKAGVFYYKLLHLSPYKENILQCINTTSNVLLNLLILRLTFKV